MKAMDSGPMHGDSWQRWFQAVDVLFQFFNRFALVCVLPAQEKLFVLSWLQVTQGFAKAAMDP